LELVISLTIFGILSVMILDVYFSATNTSRRLNATRQLSETAREMLDRISDDVRNSGINRESSNLSPNASPFYNTQVYTGS
jgi:type II secretory pathway pseudopilin PulG